MLDSPPFRWPRDRAGLRDLVDAHPWATLVSDTPAGLVVSHLPVLPDPGAPDPALSYEDDDRDERVVILGHLARTDAEEHRLGEVDAVVVVQGEHGYVSPGWYKNGPYVSTWNYVVAHLHGRPEVLGSAESWQVLDATTRRFEDERPDPFRLEQVQGYAAGLAPHVRSFRLRPSRVVAKAKLSQDKPAADVAGVLRGLERPDDVHRNPALAATMRRLAGPAT